MTPEELKKLIEEQGEAIAALQSQNDSKIEQEEKKGAADPITVEQVNRINDTLDAIEKKAEDDAKIQADLDLLKKSVAESAADGYGEEKAEALETAEYKQAFEKFVRQGTDKMSDDEIKSLSVGSDPDGGYLVRPEMYSQIITKIFETSPMRQICDVVQIGSDALEFIIDNDEPDAGCTTEKAARPETDASELAVGNIPTHEIYAFPKATKKLLEDASVDMEAWLVDKLRKKFGRMQNTAFVSGNGVGKPKGFLSYASGTAWGEIERIVSGANGAVTADGLIKLLYSLKDEYAANASFIANRLTIRDIRLLKGSDNNYLWTSGLAGGTPNTILDRPYVAAEDMPIAGSGSESIGCGDFKEGYKIVDRVGFNLLRDPFTAKPFIGFYATARVGGGVVNSEAIKVQKLAAS